MEACAGGHKEVVEVLIKANANVNIQDKVRGRWVSKLICSDRRTQR